MVELPLPRIDPSVTGRPGAGRLAAAWSTTSRAGAGRVRRASRIGALVAVLLVAAACGGSGSGGPIEWRGVSLEVPEDWVVFEEREDLLSIASTELGQEEGEPRERPEEDVAAMFFTYEPNTQPGDWRDYAEAQDAELESDESITIDGSTPATELVLSYETNDIPTRELVVVIPSRSLVVLAQPVPDPGDTDAPEVFDDNVDTFRTVLDSLELGAPPEED